MSDLKIVYQRGDISPLEPIEKRKKELRAYMRARRANNENRDVKEELLIENLLSLGGIVKDKENFFVYLSYSSEAPTDGLIERLLTLGKKVFCPRVEDDEMRAVAFLDDFTLSKEGIREPLGEPFLGRLDVAVTPLYAVDEQGNRLGYGKGYYDNFFQKRRDILKIGYCFDFQILSQVPHTAADVPLDIIVTDKRVLILSEKIKSKN